MDGSGSARVVPAVEERPEFGLEGDIGRIEHLPAGDDHDVEATRGFVMAKQLAGKPFGPIPHHGRTELPGRGDAQPGFRGAVWPDENGHQAARSAPPGIVEPLKVGARTDVLGRAEPGHF